MIQLMKRLDTKWWEGNSLAVSNNKFEIGLLQYESVAKEIFSAPLFTYPPTFINWNFCVIALFCSGFFN